MQTMPAMRMVTWQVLHAIHLIIFTEQATKWCLLYMLHLTSSARNSPDILCTKYGGNWHPLHSLLLGPDGDGSLKR